MGQGTYGRGCRASADIEWGSFLWRLSHDRPWTMVVLLSGLGGKRPSWKFRVRPACPVQARPAQTAGQRVSVSARQRVSGSAGQRVSAEGVERRLVGGVATPSVRRERSDAPTWGGSVGCRGRKSELAEHRGRRDLRNTVGGGWTWLLRRESIGTRPAGTRGRGSGVLVRWCPENAALPWAGGHESAVRRTTLRRSRVSLTPWRAGTWGGGES